MTPIPSGPADAACNPRRQSAVTSRQRTPTDAIAVRAALDAGSGSPA